MLSVLSILGLLVGLAGGLISQLTKTSFDIEGTTRKRLTNSGKIAVAISILGFTGSFTAELLKASNAQREKAQKLSLQQQDSLWKAHVGELSQKTADNTAGALQQTEANLRATMTGFEQEQQTILQSKLQLLKDNLLRETRLFGRISASSGPLTSLTVRLTVSDVPLSIRNQLSRAIETALHATDEAWYQDLAIHHNVDDQDDAALTDAVYLQQVVQPFINWLSGRPYRTAFETSQGSIVIPNGTKDEQQDYAQEREGLLALTLGHQAPALLGIGWLHGPEQFPMEARSRNPGDTTVQLSLLPSGLLFGEEINYRQYGINAVPRLHYNRPECRLEIKGTSIILNLYLNQNAIADAVLRFAPESFKTAAMPDEVSFFSWGPFRGAGAQSRDDLPVGMPFNTDGLGPTLSGLQAAGFAKPKPTGHSIMQLRLQLIPNGQQAIARTYDLYLNATEDIEEGPRDDEPFGYTRFWKGKPHGN